MTIAAPGIVLEQLQGLPGGEALLEAAAGREDVELVGGAVRDLLLSREPRELDVVVEGDLSTFARELLLRIGSEATLSEYERFGTALLTWDGGQIDIATRRAESYRTPGALPEVRAGSEQADLLRRDFTVNAIAVRLGGRLRGDLRAPPGALQDLEQRRLRVLHEQSFRDDPTRLLRVARYAARLGFEIEGHTAGLAAEAIGARALETVSGARIGTELRLALAEEDALATLRMMDSLGLLTALHPRLRLDAPSVADALALLPEDGRPDLLMMAGLALALVLSAGEDPEVELSALLNRLEFAAADRDRVLAAARAAVHLRDGLALAESPSQLRARIGGTPPEGVALAGAYGNGAAARSWLEEIRHTRLQIDGADLIAAGLPEGPEIGRRLDAVLKRRLDGELPAGREAELRACLEGEHERG